MNAFDAALINYLASACLNDARGNREHAKRLAEQVTLQVITRIDESFKCDHCKKLLWREVRLGPMLKDEVWLQLAAEYETLCGACVVERAAACGVPITFADLRPCTFNLMGGAVKVLALARTAHTISQFLYEQIHKKRAYVFAHKVGRLAVRCARAALFYPREELLSLRRVVIYCVRLSA